MQVSKVDRQVVVTMPAGAVVSEVVRDFLLSLWNSEEWNGNIAATFAPVLVNGSQFDNETKYTAIRSMIAMLNISNLIMITSCLLTW